MKNFKILSLLYAGRQSILDNIRESILNSVSYLYIKVYLSALFALNLAIWLISRHIKTNINVSQMALHYNVDFGIDYYDNSNKIYIIPLMGLIIIFINFFIFVSVSRHKDRKFISHLLLSAAIITNILLLIAIITIYLINFR